jgi:hypothetical protein
MEQKTRSQLVEEARKAVRAMFELRRVGASGAAVARANGFADGFMRGLREAHLCSDSELLEMVQTERQRLDGPALRVERPVAPELVGSAWSPQTDGALIRLAG